MAGRDSRKHKRLATAARRFCPELHSLNRRLGRLHRETRRSLRALRANPAASIALGLVAAVLVLAVASQLQIQGRNVAEQTFEANRGSGGPGKAVRLTPRWPVDGPTHDGFIYLDFTIQDLDVTSDTLKGTAQAYLAEDKFHESYPRDPIPDEITVSITGEFTSRDYDIPLGTYGDEGSGEAVPVAFEAWGESRAFPGDAYGSSNFVDVQSGFGFPTLKLVLSPGLSDYSVQAAFANQPYLNFFIKRSVSQSIWVIVIGSAPILLLISCLVAFRKASNSLTGVEVLGVGAGFLALLPLRQVLVPEQIQSLTRLDYLLGLELFASICLLAYLNIRNASGSAGSETA